MILKDISNLRYLDAEIRYLEASIAKLSNGQYPEEASAEVAELLGIEHRWLYRIKTQRDHLVHFIADLPAGEIQEAVICRAVLGLTWEETALKVCGRLSATAALNQRIKRYIRSLEVKGNNDKRGTCCSNPAVRGTV